MSEFTNNQLLAIELRKIANLVEKIPLHATISVQLHGVCGQARQSLMELFGGEKAFNLVQSGSCVWHETQYVFGDMELTLHHASGVAA